jgi:hypothetical protein
LVLVLGLVLVVVLVVAVMVVPLPGSSKTWSGTCSRCHQIQYFQDWPSYQCSNSNPLYSHHLAGQHLHHREATISSCL